MGCRMEKFIPIVNRKECCKVWLDDVVYIENEGRRVKIVTDEKAPKNVAFEIIERLQIPMAGKEEEA